MAKALVVVESPAKAKTINKYLGSDYKVVASMGHVRDLPKSKLGVDVEEGFEPSYEVIASRKKVLKELKDAAKRRDRHLRRDRPRPRRRGDRLASGRGARRRQQEEDPPADVQRDHEEGCPRGDRAPDDHQQADGRRAAGAPRARPARRLQDQPAALGQGAPRPERRPRAVGGAEAGRAIASARSSAFVAEEYWNITARLAATVPPEFDAQPAEEGRREHQGRQRGGSQRGPRRPEAGGLDRQRRSRRRSGRRAPFRRSSRASCSRPRGSRSRRR